MTQIGVSWMKGAKTLSSNMGESFHGLTHISVQPNSIHGRVPTLEGLAQKGYGKRRIPRKRRLLPEALESPAVPRAALERATAFERDAEPRKGPGSGSNASSRPTAQGCPPGGHHQSGRPAKCPCGLLE